MYEGEISCLFSVSCATAAAAACETAFGLGINKSFRAEPAGIIKSRATKLRLYRIRVIRVAQFRRWDNGFLRWHSGWRMGLRVVNRFALFLESAWSLSFAESNLRSESCEGNRAADDRKKTNHKWSIKALARLTIICKFSPFKQQRKSAHLNKKNSLRATRKRLVWAEHLFWCL